MPNVSTSQRDPSVQIALLIDSTNRVEKTLIQTNDHMNKLLEFQVRTEERRLADEEWRKRVEKHQDSQDQRIDKAQGTADDAKSQSLSNGKWINVGVAVLTAILIFIAREVISNFM